MLKRFVVCALIFCSLCSLGSLSAAAAAPAQIVSLGDGITVDTSAAGKGCIEICRQKDNQHKYKAVLCKDGGTMYSYNLLYSDGVETIRLPLSEGSGDYSLKICRQKSGTRYTVLYNAALEVELEDEMGPFLAPNEYVDYSVDGQAVCSSSKNVSKRSPKRLAPWST